MWQTLMNFLSINNVAFHLIGYDISWLELLGTAFGLWSVWWTAKDRWENWPIGIINIVFFFILFYQIQLYSDMLLQVVFLVVSIYGWWDWTHPRENANEKGMLKVSWNSRRTNVITLGVCVVACVVWGYVVAHLNLWLPTLFPQPASYPYLDAIPMVLSVVATYWQALKKVESWWLWIAVDIECTVLYLLKGTLFMSIEYFIFGIICIFGMLWWIREWKTYPENQSSAIVSEEEISDESGPALDEAV
jgi:nicotinamide mononucleotide transporter